MRPRVLLNMASSLDGKINPATRSGPFVMSRHAEDGRRMLAIRARADAIVIGAGNLRADDPDLGVTRGPGAGRPPLRVLVTTRGESIRGDEAIFDPARGGPTLVAHAASMPAATLARLGARSTLAALGDDDVDVARLLALLGVTYGCRVVLLEGGAALNARFFAARAVDEMYLTVVPRILGGGAPTAVSGAGFAEGDVPDATLLRADVLGDELFLHYAFAWPARAPVTGVTDRSAAPPR
jgi:diaminohydroxyphosphoribosylaminopyrimidine deaminase/5-amino-6-(5-phosphoribosylamino)uracil reductase